MRSTSTLVSDGKIPEISGEDIFGECKKISVRKALGLDKTPNKVLNDGNNIIQSVGIRRYAWKNELFKTD